MLGPIVNAAAIIGCSLAGLLLSKILGESVPDRIQHIIMKALGLAVIYIGISGAMESTHSLVLILSMVIGSIIGEAINIDRAMNRLGEWTEKKLGLSKQEEFESDDPEFVLEHTGKRRSGSYFTKGFVSATIIFCTGSMAIVGAMQSGLMGDHEMLFAKSILDGTICILFAYQMGIGVAFSAVPTFIYEGLIAFVSMKAAGFVPADMIVEMGASGSLIIAAIGFNFLDIKEIKAANMIPAVFMPCLIMGIQNLF